MLITVITVCYNSELTIADACSSVKSQVYPFVEHLIIDGGSKDRTGEFVASHARDGYRYFSEPDRGIYDAMNKGLRLAKGEVVGFVNSDDVFAHRNVLSRVARAMSDKSVDACYSDIVYVDYHDLSNVKRWWRTSARGSKPFSLGWVPAHPSFYFRRSLVEKYGLMDDSLNFAADHEFMTRLMARYFIGTVYVEDIWIKMRVGGVTNNSLRNVFLGNCEIFRGMIRNRIFISPLIFCWKIFDRFRQRLGGKLLTEKIKFLRLANKEGHVT